MLEALLMGGIAFGTSTLTGIVGLGGGLLLLSVLPGFLPLQALIPVHGVVQLASNTSRALFAVARIQWSIVVAYVVGAAVGALAGSRFVLDFPIEHLPLLLGVFILLVTWVPVPKGARACPERGPSRIGARFRFGSLGAVQTFLSLFVGATGPLSAPLLMREGLAREPLVATQAMFLTVAHLAKALTFGLLVFAFGLYLKVTFAMSVGAIAGSWVGTRLRSRVPELLFRRLFQVVITLLALRLMLN